ncbi:class I SAM-dependent methyltransferase [Georgenia yuyongxinii]|uniref:class I SAM-dependent methyltransferase n=1 Tax=Georgenia yuyongxinii TaxID=2589797 RepID=UPI001C8F94D7|nr:methyltransferase domain-containing protein [Georgenia yuyongxinii]
MGLVGLEEALPRRAGRRALDVACGLGAVSLWAAKQGFVVDAVDRSAVAISRLRENAVALGLDGLVRARVADVAGALPADVIGPYDLVVCQRFRDQTVLRLLPELLCADGVLVVTVLSAAGAAAPSRFAAGAGELSHLARTAQRCEVLRDVEGNGEATIVLRRTG